MLHWLRLHPRRLLTAPRVEVTAVAPGSAQVTVHGLVCGVCAMRARTALERVPGVSEACVDLEGGTATLSIAAGADLDGRMQDEMQRALDRVVVAMPVRRAIARIVDALRAIGPTIGLGRAEGHGA